MKFPLIEQFVFISSPPPVLIPPGKGDFMFCPPRYLLFVLFAELAAANFPVDSYNYPKIHKDSPTNRTNAVACGALSARRDRISAECIPSPRPPSVDCGAPPTGHPGSTHRVETRVHKNRSQL